MGGVTRKRSVGETELLQRVWKRVKSRLGPRRLGAKRSASTLLFEFVMSSLASPEASCMSEESSSKCLIAWPHCVVVHTSCE